MLPESILINPPKFDPLAAYGIGVIAVVMAVLSIVVYAGRKRGRAWRLTLGLAILLGLSALAANSGLLARFDLMPPPMLIMIGAVLGLSFAVGFSPLGKTLASETSLWALVALQSFRLPLELVMHHAAQESIMPVQLSYAGYNFDILTGLGATLLGLALKLNYRVPHKLVWVWNVWGLLCLFVIVCIAFATSPMVHAFGLEPANLNTWVLFFPYVWLPVVLVTLALSGQLIITRKLLHMKN